MLAAVLVAVVVVSAVGCGGDDSATPGVRVIEIQMVDSRFIPDLIEVKVGETVTLRFTNTGSLRHEAVIGDEITQIVNEQQMQQLLNDTTIPISPITDPGPQSARRGRSARAPTVLAHPGMSSANMVSVEPGASGEITFTFNKAGTLLMGCHEPGHYAAGMVGTINITG